MLLETSDNFVQLVVLVTVWQLLTQTVYMLVILSYTWTGFSAENTLIQILILGCHKYELFCMRRGFLTSIAYFMPKGC